MPSECHGKQQPSDPEQDETAVQLARHRAYVYLVCNAGLTY